LKAIEIARKWNPEWEEKINNALGNTPEPDMDWRSWGPMKSRRAERVLYK